MNEEKKRMAATALGLPKDVVLGDVLVRFTGFHEVCIENSPRPGTEDPVLQSGCNGGMRSDPIDGI